jgi:hypothetical protein
MGTSSSDPPPIKIPVARRGGIGTGLFDRPAFEVLLGDEGGVVRVTVSVNGDGFCTWTALPATHFYSSFISISPKGGDNVAFTTATSTVQTGNWLIKVMCSSGHTTYKDQMHPNAGFHCGMPGCGKSV